MTEFEKQMLAMMQDIKTDVAGIKEDVAMLKEDFAMLKEDVAMLKEDVAGLKEEVRRLDQKSDTVDRKVDRNFDEIAKGVARIVDEMGESQTELKRRIERAEVVAAQNSYDIQWLKTRVS